jgi:hypothetical protein
VTTAVGADVADARPALLVAVTTTRRVEPTSLSPLGRGATGARAAAITTPPSDGE